MKTPRLILIVSLFVLITLACNAPVFSRFQTGTNRIDGDSETSDTLYPSGIQIPPPPLRQML
jgi:hypothetical protein